MFISQERPLSGFALVSCLVRPVHPVVCLFICLLPLALLAQTPKESKVRHDLPQLLSVFPQGSEPGKVLQLEALGAFLDRSLAVIFLDTSIRGKVLESGPASLKLEFQVDTGASFGPHYFRVVSPRGASNLLLFRVGDQPHQLEHEPNNSFEKAESVTLPLTLNSRLDSQEDVDFYRFRASKGETWIFDLRAARNGNGLDAALILLDSSRRELDHSEDYFDWDPFLSFTFAETAVYFVVVQSSVDPSFAYQLDIRQAPYLETVSPLSLAPGADSKVTLYGIGLLPSQANLEFDDLGFSGEILEMCGSKSHVRIRVPQQARQGEHRLALVSAAGRSNWASFLVDSTPIHHSGEKIEPPVSITGVARYSRPDHFFFHAKANQSLVFEVRASRFGSPADTSLRLLNEKGEEIAQNDDGEFPGKTLNRDSLITQTFTQEGDFELQIRNMWAVEGENYPYQLLVRYPQPGVELMLDTDQPFVHSAGTSTLKVKAIRKGGFDAAISLNVTGLPGGVTADPAEIPVGKSEAEIVLRAGDVRSGTYSQIQVISQQTEGPAWKTLSLPRQARGESKLKRVDSATLVVAEKPRFSLEAAVYSVTLARGNSFEFAVHVQRQGGFDREVQLAFENLPPGVTADPVLVSGGDASKEAKVLLHADSSAPASRSEHVVILGKSSDGEIQQAPQIGLTVE